MNPWNMEIHRAGYDRAGAELAADQSTLEYCLRPPQVWESDAGGGIALRVIGWAVSLRQAPVLARVSDQHSVRKWARPVHARPDVASHYARQGVAVSEHAGFDFLLYLADSERDGLLRIELFSGNSASGALDFDVAKFYREHRQQVGNETRFTGLLGEAG